MELEMAWYWQVLIAAGINWIGCYILCSLYCLWLRFISHDVTFEGWIIWRGFFPIARWRLISKKSWFARMWDRFYGHGLLGHIIHRDEPGKQDDKFVEITIVHEVRHTVQQLILGSIFYIIYGIDFLFNGYQNVWFEKDARNAAEKWVKKGRPRIFKIWEASINSPQW